MTLSCSRHQALPVLDTTWKELFGRGEQCQVPIFYLLSRGPVCFPGGYRLTAINNNNKKISKNTAKLLHLKMVRSNEKW